MSAKIYDVIIVGGGMVGAALSCALAKQNLDLRIAVIEGGEPPLQYKDKEFDPRVVALTRSAENFLSDLGAWSLITAERVCPYTHMHVWDAEGTGYIDFDCRDIRENNLGHIVENSVAVRALWKTMKQLQRADSQIDFFQPRQLDQVELSVGEADRSSRQTTLILDDGTTLQGELLVACDGARSKVRDLLDFNTQSWSYGQSAIITTVETEHGHGHTARQRFMDSGPLAFLPLQVQGGELGQDANEHYCSIVWSAEESLAEELMALDDKTFCVRLGRDFENRLGKITSVAQRYCIPLQQQRAVEYIRPGVALAGDAAHTIHPLAGQGVNLGLEDAQALSVEISRARQRQIPLGDISILRRYQRARKADNLATMATMEGFKRLFSNPAPIVRWLRNEGMRQLNQFPLVKNKLVRRALRL